MADRERRSAHGQPRPALRPIELIGIEVDVRVKVADRVHAGPLAEKAKG